MRHISIIGKFLIIMALFGVFSVGTTLYSSKQIKNVDDGYAQVLDGESRAALYMSRANSSLEAARAALGDMLMSRSKALNSRAEEALEATKAKFATYMDQAIAAVPGNSALPDLKAQGLAHIEQTCSLTITAALKSTKARAVAAAQQMFLTQCQPGFGVLSETFIKLNEEIVQTAEDRAVALAQDANQAAISTLIAIAAGLLVMLPMGFFAVRSLLVKPIQQMSETMGILADGDYTVDVDGTDRRDEIGTMAKAVQVFKDNGLRAKALEQEAQSNRSATEAERARGAEVERRRTEEMAHATSGLAEGLKRLSEGDLTVHLDEPFAQEFESLRSDFNVTVEKLASSIQSVADTTGTIDNGAGEIARSTDDLSRRTEQQAASLEETAAALDQITSNVSNSYKRTEDARQIGVEANQSAQRSGEVVSRAVNAMQRIEESSSQITNIIGVIDEIAFQTNLLALNAGVEAARAGEAGKGFAVVAQEVRELAQRSAQAAKEIKELISKSGSEVSTGVQLVSETGDALKVIEDQVILINDQLNAISNAAKEQSVGLEEVNKAVNQMDQVTQQNAAMVEESNAASATLAEEVQRLRQIVSAFRISDARLMPSSSLQEGDDEDASQSAEASAPQAASDGHSPAASPARQMMAKVAAAVGAGGSAAAAADDWEEF